MRSGGWSESKLQTKDEVSQITMRYRRKLGEVPRPLSLRAFAKLLSEALVPHHRRISHQSIKNWSDRRYVPDRSLMMQIAEQAEHDWRGDFAREILTAIEDKGIFSPAK